MEKIEIKIGDYIETIHGNVGYVAEFINNDGDDENPYVTIFWANTKNNEIFNYKRSANLDKLSKYFNQIGKHKFNQNKMEKIDLSYDIFVGNNKAKLKVYNGENFVDVFSRNILKDIEDKINEIIDYLNK